MTLALYGKSKRRQSTLLIAALIALVGSIVMAMAALTKTEAAPGDQFAVYTSIENISTSSQCENGGGTGVNCNQYNAKTSVYLNGGPSSAFLPDAWYCFSVYNPSGSTLLSSDLSIQRTFQVVGGDIVYGGSHDTGADTRTADVETTIGFFPFNDSPNSGGVYKYTLYQYAAQPSGTAVECAAGALVTKTDNFSIEEVAPTPPGLTVVKQVQSSTGADITSAEDFSFTITPATGVTPATFNLDDDADPALPNTQVVTLPVTTGADDTYTITEGVETGFTLFSVSCTGTGVTATDTGAEDRDIQVTVTNSASATCTFINRANAIVAGTRNLRVVKVSDDTTHAGGTFTGTITPGGDSAADDAFSLSLAANVQVSAPDVNSVSTDAQAVVEATPPANWALTGYAVVLDPTGVYACTGLETYGPTAAVPADANNYTVCIKNTFTAPPTSSVTVAKTHSAGSPYTIGGPAFQWTLAVTVAGANTTGVTTITDTIPAGLVAEAHTGYTMSTGITCTNADANDQTVSCALASGSVPGTYNVVIDVTVPANAQCTTYLNTVTITGTNVTANNQNPPNTATATDTVSVTGCGTITFNKADGVRVGNEIHWTISVTNSSAVAGSATITDPGTTLETELCTNTFADVDGANTTDGIYTCAVGANSTVSFVVSTQYPSNPGQCNNTSVSNTASMGNTSDTAQYSDTAQPTVACLDITKVASNTQQPTWTINVISTADVAVPVFVVDAGAAYVSATGGTCTATAGNLLTAGIACSVNANATLIITVTKPMPALTCEGTDVSNSVTVHLGTSVNGSLIETAVGGTFDNVGATPALCNVIVQLCKEWNTGADAIINADRDFVVSVSDTTETELVTIQDVTEGGTTECILLSVAPGLVDFTETVPTGFQTPTWTVSPGASGSGNEVTLFVTGNTCGVGQVSLIAALVSSIMPLVSVVTEGTPICTVTFINVDTGVVAADGGLIIQKFLDLNGDGDANDAGEGPLANWSFTTTGGGIQAANQVRQTNAAGQITEYAVGFDPGTILNVTETQQTGFVLTDVELDGVSVGTSLSNNVTIQSGQVRVIRYFNQPNREIRVVKVAVTRHNLGADVAAPNDDDGWSITVSSAQCQFSQTLQTDANGVAVFTNLPLCTDFVVSENPVNAGSPGFQPVSAVQFTAQTPGVIGNPLVVTFVNRRSTSDTPCVNCNPVTPTPVVPTATPTSTPTGTTPAATPTATRTTTSVPATPTATATRTVTVVPPTNTPVPPTNTPVSVVQGARTTPVAPSAGDSLTGTTNGGMNFLLMASGLLALSAGLTALAFGSRRK